MTATLEKDSELANNLEPSGSMKLATKYRPMRFQDVQGQPEVHGLAAQIDRHGQGYIGQAFLFEGTRGSGKTTSARILARAVNCKDIQPGGEPCNKCESCDHIISYGWEDAIIEVDAASNRSVNDVRELISRTTLATRANRRVIIIDEAHSLTNEAQESLLKTLEEPNDQVIWIFCTTDKAKIKSTIISRCTSVSMRDLPEDTLMQVLNNINEKEGFDLPPEIISKAAYRGHGSARDAITALQGLMLHDGDNTVQNFKMLDDAFASKSEGEFIRAFDQVYSIEPSFNPTDYTQHLIETLRSAMIVQIDETSIDERHEFYEQIDEFANVFGTQRIIRALRHFGSELPNISRTGVNNRVVLEAAVMAFLVPSSSGNVNMIFDAIDELKEELHSFMNEMREALSSGHATSPSLSQATENKSEEKTGPWDDGGQKSDPLDDLPELPAKNSESKDEDDAETEDQDQPETDEELSAQEDPESSDDQETLDEESSDENQESEPEESEEPDDEPLDDPEEAEDSEESEEDSKYPGTKASDNKILDAYYDDALENKKIGSRARKALDVDEDFIIIERKNKIAIRIIVKTDGNAGRVATEAMSKFFEKEFGMEFVIQDIDEDE